MQAHSELERLLIAIEGIAYAEPAQAFCGRFMLSGETVKGGQSVVAFARSGRAGMQQYGIKCDPRPKAAHANCCGCYCFCVGE